jgi:hypothetical protein
MFIKYTYFFAITLWMTKFHDEVTYASFEINKFIFI